MTDLCRAASLRSAVTASQFLLRQEVAHCIQQLIPLDADCHKTMIMLHVCIGTTAAVWPTCWPPNEHALTFIYDRDMLDKLHTAYLSEG